MLSVIICEDEPIQTTLLVKLVQQWADQCALPVQILSYPNAESFLFSYEEQPFGDILLLDIQMAQMNGMELARKIRERNRRIQITFLAGLPDFISEGYEVDALHYLIKPIQEKKLFQVLDRAVLNLQQAPKVVLLPINGRPVRIPITDIFYAEAFSHTILLHLADGEESLRMRMSDLQELLGEDFCRCHRSYIVSLEHIRHLSRSAVFLDNGQQIPLPAARMTGFIRRLSIFIEEGSGVRIFDFFFQKAISRRISAFQDEMMNRHVAEVENLYRQMRGWRHDYHNHIQMMKAYRALGQDDRLDAYLDELEQDLKDFDVLIRSGNVMIDAVLNSKLSLAKSHGIAINAKAVVPQELSFPDIDLCVILGNLLDNAIEACQWLEEPASRFIRVYLDLKGENLYLCITNSTGKIQKRNGKYVSRKAGRHGFGLQRVDRLISRYQGYLKRADEEGVFTCEVLLPLGSPL